MMERPGWKKTLKCLYCFGRRPRVNSKGKKVVSYNLPRTCLAYADIASSLILDGQMRASSELFGCMRAYLHRAVSGLMKMRWKFDKEVALPRESCGQDRTNTE